MVAGANDVRMRRAAEARVYAGVLTAGDVGTLFSMLVHIAGAVSPTSSHALVVDVDACMACAFGVNDRRLS